MKRYIIILVGIFFILCSNLSAFEIQYPEQHIISSIGYHMKHSELIGRWELVSWTHQDVDTNKVYYPFGQKPTGYIEFSNEKILASSTKDKALQTARPSIEKLNTPLYDDSLVTLSHVARYHFDEQKQQLNYVYEESSMPEMVGKERAVNVWFDGHRTVVVSMEKEAEGKRYSIKATYLKMPS